MRPRISGGISLESLGAEGAWPPLSDAGEQACAHDMPNAPLQIAASGMLSTYWFWQLNRKVSFETPGMKSRARSLT